MSESRILEIASRYSLSDEDRAALLDALRANADDAIPTLDLDPDEEDTVFQPGAALAADLAASSTPGLAVSVKPGPSGNPVGVARPSGGPVPIASRPPDSMRVLERAPIASPTARLPDPVPEEAPRRSVVSSPRKMAPPVPAAPVVPPPRPLDDALDEPTMFQAVVLPQAPKAPAPKDPADRYEDLGLIGTGATAEVRRVRDADLNRVMAMKIIHKHLQKSKGVVARFVSEAQATAQLEHPGIIPVHAMGQLPDGRYYFTMKEVRGHTLGEVIKELHKASVSGRWGATRDGWTFRRLIEAFRKVCEAVGYAHARGVVHRDLKPENIMVGPFGEVVVMDWGLAKILGAVETLPDNEAVQTMRSKDDAFSTRIGSIAGTPTYMPPEQARGAHDEVGPPSDVYALGAILYEVLAGKPPYEGTDAIHVLAQVLDGPPPAPGRIEVPGVNPAMDEEVPVTGPPAIPAELQQICLRAIHRDRAERYPDGGALAAEIEAWLDGAKKREQAKIELDRARELWQEITTLREQATQADEEARAMLANIRPWEPVDRKRPAWSLEDRAARLNSKADLKEVVMTQVLQAALTFVPEHNEAHDILASQYRALHASAEARRDRAAVTRYEVLLQAHDTGAHTAYVRGDGALTIVTDPPDAEIELLRFVPFDRRLRTVPMRVIGRSPLHAFELQRGSYLLKIRAPGRVEVRYPIFIGREEHWDGVPPGATEPQPIYLPTAKEVGAGGLYVPAGWMWAGGDADAPESLSRRRLWVDGFVVQKNPITNWEFISFLDALVRAGKEREALKRAPRERGGTVGKPGALIFGRDPEGRFVLRQDADGDRWEPTWPVLMVDWPAAVTYGRWHAARTRQPWRLPTSWEWEKAARGVDGRFYPWGDYLDPTWCCMSDSHERRPTVSPVDAWPVDESPYGVRGLAGNARDWCVDPHAESQPEDGSRVPAAPDDRSPDLRAAREVRGGWWSGNAHTARAAARDWLEPERRGADVSFRLARPLNGPDGT